MDCLRSSQSEPLAVSVLSFLHCLGELGPEGRQLVSFNGGTKFSLLLLKTYPTSREVQESGVALLASLAEDDIVAKNMAQEETLLPLVDKALDLCGRFSSVPKDSLTLRQRIRGERNGSMLPRLGSKRPQAGRVRRFSEIRIPLFHSADLDSGEVGSTHMGDAFIDGANDLPSASDGMLRHGDETSRQSRRTPRLLRALSARKK